MIHGHVFELFTIVAHIDDGIDVVFGMKNLVEIEGILNMRTSSVDFLNRSIPIYPQNTIKVKPHGTAYIKIVAPFSTPIQGRAICKFFGYDGLYTFKMRMKNNKSVVRFDNNNDHEVELS